MRLIIISDTHTLHDAVKTIPSLLNPDDENNLIHCGDISNRGEINNIHHFLNWLHNLKGFDRKFFIAGNHDLSFQDINYKPRSSMEGSQLIQLLKSLPKDMVYLEDETYSLYSESLEQEVNFYGTPWQPEFMDWGYNLPRNGNELQQKWEEIPNNTHILITHTPPFGFLDKLEDGNSVGCELLRERVLDFKPMVNCFGHIHNGYGTEEYYDTLFVNASICNENYNPKNKPIVVDLIKENDKIRKVVI